MKTVAFHTLGCKVNQYETEAMEELFEKQGYSIIDSDKLADIYVINTCTFPTPAILDSMSSKLCSKLYSFNC